MKVVRSGQGGRKTITVGGHIRKSLCGRFGGFQLLGGVLPCQTPIGDLVAPGKGRHAHDKRDDGGRFQIRKARDIHASTSRASLYRASRSAYPFASPSLAVLRPRLITSLTPSKSPASAHLFKS